MNEKTNTTAMKEVAQTFREYYWYVIMLVGVMSYYIAQLF